MAHTFSRTWTAPELTEKTRFDAVRAGMLRMELPRPGLPRPNWIHKDGKERPWSPERSVVPWNWKQWVEHRTAMLEYKRKKIQRHLSNQRERPRSRSAPPTQPLLGKTFTDGRGLVLAEKTIWTPCIDIAKERYGSLVWPTREELKYEGDERMKSEKGPFRRFPPLPRAYMPDGPNTSWQLTNYLTPFDFDITWRVPDWDDIWLNEEELGIKIYDFEAPQYLNQDLIAALDDPDEY